MAVTTFYAQQADVETFVENWVTDDPDALARLISRCEDDIDLAVGALLVETNGRKFGSPATTNEKHLRPDQVTSLRNATCAQVEYRFALGEQFFVMPSPEGVSGPDYTAKGTPPKLAPKARRYLQDGGLFLLAGHAREGYGRYPRRQYDRFLTATRHDGT